MRLAVLVFPDFQLLDAAGPLAAFEVASRYRDGCYAMRVVAALLRCLPRWLRPS